MPESGSTTGAALSGAVVLDLVVATDAASDAAADRMHDGPMQALVVARYAADLAVRGGDPVIARDAVQDALVQLRAALWHLRPRASVEGRLGAALSLLSQRLVDEGRQQLDIEEDAAVVASLSPTFASFAYRLVQTVALPVTAGPVRVVLHRVRDCDILELVGGVALSDPEAWMRGARALGGTLTTTTIATEPTRLVFAIPHATAGVQQ